MLKYNTKYFIHRQKSYEEKNVDTPLSLVTLDLTQL